MQSKAKGKGNLSVLMDYAGRRRVLTYLSWVLSAVSALTALVPFSPIFRGCFPPSAR